MMAAPNIQPEPELQEVVLDDKGKLSADVSVAFGPANAGRRVRLSFDPLPFESEYQGSRRHILDLLGRSDWTSQLNDLIAVPDIALCSDPYPIPTGHWAAGETDLDTYIRRHCVGVWPQAEMQLDRGRWWAPNGGTRPQMDLICRLKVNQKDGLLFVEAKAHEGELDWGGKPLDDDASQGSRENHENIVRQIERAKEEFNRSVGSGFNLSIYSHYQLVNRLTYLWQIASLGIPVVLLYLGFTNDEYFPSDYLRDDRHWQRVMGGYMQGIVPHGFPERRHQVAKGASLELLVRSLPLSGAH
jgi:hypothetical protein